MLEPSLLKRWLIQRRLGLSVGLAVTAVAVAAHLSGWTQRLEWMLYDTLVRHASTVPAAGHILHVDIDDDAIARYASWPWPRDTQADLVRTLSELGARRIVMDLVWTEPKPPEIRAADLDRYADIEGTVERIGRLSAENVAYPDDELAAAIAAAGNVHLAMYCMNHTEPPGGPLETGIAHLLHRDFSLTAEAIADRLGTHVDDVAAALPRVKRRVARELVADRMNGDPPPTARQIHESLLPTPFERLTADREDLLAAYHRELGLRNLIAHGVPVPQGLRGKLPVIEDVNPPVYKFTAAGSRTGFVNFQPDRDGVLRRIPLLYEWNGRLIEQLGFTAARDELGIEPEDLSIEGSHLLIAARGLRPAMRVQLDENGCMLINWHVADDASRPFGHLPVTRLLQIVEARRRLRQNDVLEQVRLAEAMQLAKGEAGYAVYREQVNRLLELRRRLRMAELRRQPDKPKLRETRAEADQLAQTIDQDHMLTSMLIRETWAELKKEPDPADPAIAAEYDRFARAARLIDRDIPAITAANTEIRGKLNEWTKKLRPIVADKVCFVGYTATAIADMVNTPPLERMAGVQIHSQLFNDFAQRRFLSWAGPLTRGGAIVALGLTATVAATTAGPWASLLILVVVVTLAGLLNAVGLFAEADYWLALLTALIATFVAWALIVMIRYLVTDRERRRFSRAVAQYVSPAMARRLGESAQSLSLAPTDAVVSCLFSDLAGFTTLSERLGPAGTRAVLNPYLQAMSEALHRRDALINKFMGDGIFAFFNPPILPCAAHEVAACESALDCQAALAELIARQADGPFAAEFRRLSMRIGIASGPVFVGDYGSEAKLDYTCMGDVVNLAARLESANKQFGTLNLLSEHTHKATYDRYVCRRLGHIQVKGQTAALGVFELLGRRGEVDEPTVSHVEMFENALRAFLRRDFAAARKGFLDCRDRKPDDKATELYLAIIKRLETTPPDDDWDGRLELTEK